VKVATIIMLLLAVAFLALALITLDPRSDAARDEAETANQYLSSGYYHGWRWYWETVLAGGPIILAFHFFAVVFLLGGTFLSLRLLTGAVGVQQITWLFAASIFPLFIGICAALIPARNLHYMATHGTPGYHVTVLWELRLILWTALVSALVPGSIALFAAFRLRRQHSNERHTRPLTAYPLLS
jgi:hypothetical protein